MRDLIIMRGCPGSGKSTAIKEAGLENYVLSPDTLRLMLRAPEVTENFTYSISQQDNALVFELLDKMLINRMKTGSPTIIDATYCSSSKFHTKQINRYRELAKQYKYRLFYWEPERESIQTYIDRNKYRDELNQVPENVIRKMYTAWEHNGLPKDFVKLNTLSFRDDFASIYKDMSDMYEQVIIVGDIHGCNTVLQKLINQDDELNIKDAKNLYIFVGDYFDRGIENLEVLDTLFDIAEQKNVVLLEGNHEAHWVDWAHDRDAERTDNGMIRFKETTLKQWQSKYNNDKVLKKNLRVLYRKMLPAYFFKFLGKTYIVTHAGLACLPKHHMATWQYINGHGGYDFDVTSAYESRAFPSRSYPIQVFGHRSAKESEHSKPLEGQVEFGGFLKYLVLNDEDNQKVIFATKSTTQGDHTKLLKDVWGQCSLDNQTLIINLCKKYNASAIFEVCHPEDIHIIDYNNQKKMFLLDFVPNQLHIDGVNINIPFSDKVCEEFSKEWKPETHICTALNIQVRSRDQLDHYIRTIFLARPTEGYVITDATGKMYKKKTDFYLKWKFYRSLIERIIEGRALPELNEEDAKFIKWLNQYCPQGNIIEIRKQYEKYLTEYNN